MRKLKYFCCLLVATWMGVTHLEAQRTLIEARIDTAAILIGEQTTVHLTVTTDKDKTVIIPLDPQLIMPGVEIVSVSKADSSLIDNDRLVIKQAVVITSFDSSLYLLPPFKVIDEADTIYSNQVALKVATIPVNTDAPEEFNDIKDVWAPRFVLSDYLSWVLPLLLILLVVGVGYYLYRRYRSKKPLMPFKKEVPALPPFEAALRSLDEIKRQKIWQKGRNKEYHTQITDTLRTYISGRYHVHAMEMTTREILTIMQQEEDGRKLFDTLKQILELADFVKFAKLHPLPDENDLSLNNAYLFVKETKEEEKELNTNEEETVKKASSATKTEQ